MRINRFLAEASQLSRRTADQAITEGRVQVNGRPATLGQEVQAGDKVILDGQEVRPAGRKTIMLHKPVGVVCSRRQQGNTPTIYSLLPKELSNLNPVGRLDKDSSGLLIMTNDGQLHQKLSHPSLGKTKVYEVGLNRPISPADLAALEQGIQLEDGPSRPQVQSASGKDLRVQLSEGRNRQIRRTFEALGYTVVRLHRTEVGSLNLGQLSPGEWRELLPEDLV